MKNVFQRFLLAGIALPLLVVVVLLLPHLHFIALALVTVVFSGLGTQEVSRMFFRHGTGLSSVRAFIAGGLLPAAAWVDTAGFLSIRILPAVLLLSLGCILTEQALIRRNEDLRDVLDRSAASMLLAVYPGLFMACIPMMTALPRPALSVLMFLAMVFANDSAAYGAGMLLGRGNRNIFAVSPNKSIAGIVGGILGSIAAAYIFYTLDPGLFPDGPFYPLLPSILTACAADIGDLAESAMKRSADIKDSGTLLKGRGGIMDSIDSILFAAPIFLGCMKILEMKGLIP